MADDDFEDFPSWDYKTDLIAEQELREESSTTNWIYVGVDLEKPGRAKIGMTTKGLDTRERSSRNTDYELLRAFKVKHDVDEDTLHAIEDGIKAELEQKFERRVHSSTGKKSEWFNGDPTEIVEVVADRLSAKHGSQMNGYFCSDRAMHVINGWRNDKVLNNQPRKPFRVTDVSDPPVSAECYMPGGCGEDCDCW
jgi:hypothetical protein